ncbi:MAG: protecting protein DprA [Marmoricola sp.]|nr:protecting protein DprA [Marmoricola sp.]
MTSVSESERLARVVLSRIGEPGDHRLTDLVHELGASKVLSSLQGQAAGGELGADLAERLESVDAVQELERASSQGIRFVVPGDQEWPAVLDDLAHAPHLHERGGVPVGLWCRGVLRLDEAAENAVAVVGSRSATTYGADVATGIAATLARASWTVVSGAAFGIDQAAHRGALSNRGRTVAVLACGADRAYPAAHRSLIDYIADVGLLVSEAPPGCAPTRIRFLARNRIIAALSRGAVVVEAAVRSGALNTASWAGGLGRTVMGIPGPVTSAPSAGAHQLIRARDALLVTSGEEVLEAVGPMGTFALADPREPENVRDRLPPRERQVLDAVPLVRAVDSDSIARTAGIAHGRTKEALLALHRAGLVEHSLGCWRVSPGPADSSGA